MNIWNSKNNTVEEALNLPKGSYCVDFGGILVEQSVQSHHVLEAATKLKEADKEYIGTSQARLMYLAQENELAFTDWGAAIVLI